MYIWSAITHKEEPTKRRAWNALVANAEIHRNLGKNGQFVLIKWKSINKIRKVNVKKILAIIRGGITMEKELGKRKCKNRNANVMYTEVESDSPRNTAISSDQAEALAEEHRVNFADR